jgi:hypothetical protein
MWDEIWLRPFSSPAPAPRAGGIFTLHGVVFDILVPGATGHRRSDATRAQPRRKNSDFQNILIYRIRKSVHI